MQKPNNRRRLRLKCPCCAGRIMDSVISVKSMLYDMEFTDELYVDYIDKCSRCKKEIGIKKV